MTFPGSEDYGPGWWREYYPVVFPLWKPWNQPLEGEAEKVIGFILQNVNWDPQAPFLDLGCGEGRHSRWLVRRGLQGYALDFFRDRISWGVERSSAQGLSGPGFIQADMRLPPFKHHSFGLILLMDTTFGIFDDPTNLLLLQQLYQLLAQGGTLFMQVLNPQFWGRGEMVVDLGKGNGWRGRLMRRYRFDQGSSLLYDQLWLEGERGEVLHRYPDQILRLYRTEEMVALCLQSGFQKVKFCSAADWGPPDSLYEFHPDSPEYYVFAQ